MDNLYNFKAGRNKGNVYFPSAELITQDAGDILLSYETWG